MATNIIVLLSRKPKGPVLEEFGKVKSKACFPFEFEWNLFASTNMTSCGPSKLSKVISRKPSGDLSGRCLKFLSLLRHCSKSIPFTVLNFSRSSDTHGSHLNHSPIPLPASSVKSSSVRSEYRMRGSQRLMVGAPCGG